MMCAVLGRCNLGWILKGPGRESWIITGYPSDLIKYLRNLFIAHASHTVPEESMADAGSTKHIIAYFYTDMNISRDTLISLWLKSKIQDKY